jgi:hypothetical protein
MSAFGSGPSNGQFWYGSTTNFPGFLYKKNVGVGGRRSTKMAPGGNITCNSSTYLYNKYKPGQGGVGASSIANRRAKNRLATVCNGNNNCFPCYPSLGQYSNYTHNPNGYIPCPYIPPSSIPPIIPPSCPYKISNGGTFENNSDLERLRGSTIITGDVEIYNFTEQPDFSVFDCVTVITGALVIFLNNLTNIVGFNFLESVNGIIIQENENLIIIQGFNSLITTIERLAIFNNIALTSVIGFNNLQTITTDLNIQSNSFLTTIPSFNSLKTIGVSLEIKFNTVLPTIPSFNSLTGSSNGTNTIGPNKTSPSNTSICQSTKTRLETYFTGSNTFTSTDVVLC